MRHNKVEFIISYRRQLSFSPRILIGLFPHYISNDLIGISGIEIGQSNVAPHYSWLSKMLCETVGCSWVKLNCTTQTSSICSTCTESGSFYDGI